MKILCFHPALAPYRIDFFRLLAGKCNLVIELLLKNLLSQNFDQERAKAAIDAKIGFVKSILWRKRAIPFGVIPSIRRENPDDVMGYECSPATLMAVVARFLFAGKFRIWTFFDDSPDQILGRRGMRRIVRDWTMRHIDGVIVPSALAENAYRKYVDHVEALKFAVVPIIHDERIQRLEEHVVFDMADRWRQATMRPGEKCILFVGRLAAVKNIGWLLSVVGSAEWPKAWRLFLVGDGEEHDALEAMSRQLGICERASFLGRRLGNELKAMFAAADCQVLCSRLEPFGAVVGEAMQWGCPAVLASTVGAKSLIRPGENGEVFEFNDQPGFIAALSQTLEYCQKWQPCRPSLIKDNLEDCVERLARIL